MITTGYSDERKPSTWRHMPPEGTQARFLYEHDKREAAFRALVGNSPRTADGNAYFLDVAFGVPDDLVPLTPA